MLTNWKLTLTYDGTDFHGWQIQPGLQTIQGTLAEAIAFVTHERVLPQGSGRTDAGVHALGQVTSFSLKASIPAANLMRALNHVLPSTIRVTSAERVRADFHARHSAIGKMYQYRVFSAARGGVCSPFLARTVCVYPWALDIEAMQQAAQSVLGQHDFASFATSDPDVTRRQKTAGASSPDMVRTLHTSEWSRGENPQDSGLLLYTVRGNGFLHHMVRNLVGTFLDVGRGRRRPETVPGILAARDRTKAGPTAPAAGLFLVKVEYTENFSSM